MSNAPHPSGLDHLVEAATALTQLVHTASSMSKKPSTHAISDDEETKASQQSQQSQQSHQTQQSQQSYHSAVTTASIAPADASSSPSFSASHDNSKEIFPQRLFRILSEVTISDVITWLPHGGAFVILRPDALAESILPKFFPESCTTVTDPNTNTKSLICKYPSFTRKLNRWGFRQVTRGADSGAFHHKFFKRDDPRLCLRMVCQRSRRRKSGDKKNTLLKSSPSKASGESVLGPYSSILREPKKLASWNHGTIILGSVAPVPATENTITDCESENSAPKIVRPQAPLPTKTKTDDAMRSFTSTPPPSQMAPSAMNSVSTTSISTMSSSPTRSTSSGSQANNKIAPPTSMTRTVSNVATTVTNGTANVPFTTFNNNRLDAKSLSEHNLAINAAAAALAPAIARTAIPQALQLAHPSISSVATLNATPAIGIHVSNQNHPISLSQLQGPLSATNNTPSPPQQVMPVAVAPTMLNIPTASFTAPVTNPSIASNGSSQTAAQIRVANAKSMLYNAFLQALG